MKYFSILNKQNSGTKTRSLCVMCHHQNRSLILSIHSGELLHQTSCTSAVKRTGRYCFVSTINILWLSTQLSSICGQNKSKAAHCPSCFSFTPKLSTLFFDVFNQLRIAADEISVKCLVHRLSVNFHHMCDNLFCECRCSSDSVIAP